MNKQISSKYILQRAIDDIGEKMSDFYKNNKEVLANWILDAMRIIGNYPLLEDKKVSYSVNQYEVLLPCDYIQEIKVVDAKTKEPLSHYDKPFTDVLMNNGRLRYKNAYGKLIFNYKEAEVDLFYRAISFDEEGYVLIIDDEFDSQTRAIVQYLSMMLCKREARKGNAISLQLLQQETAEWHRLCANAGAHRYMPKTLAEKQFINNIQKAFVLNYNDYHDDYLGNSNNYQKYL